MLVYFFSNLIGKPSQKYGLPFIVLLRSSLGIKGAKYIGLIRFFFVVFFLFGIQTYFLSKALSYLIRISIFSFDSTLLDQQIFLTFFLGMNLIDWLAIVISIIFQGFLFSAGMNFNKKLIHIVGVLLNEQGQLSSISETIIVHVDMRTRKTVAMPKEFLAKLQIIKKQHHQVGELDFDLRLKIK